MVLTTGGVPAVFRIDPSAEHQYAGRVLAIKQDEKDVLPPVITNFQSEGYHIELRTGWQSVSREYLSFNSRLINHTGRAFPLAGMVLRAPNSTEDYLVDARTDHEYGALPKELGPHEEIRVTVVARSPEHLSHGWVLQLTGAIPAALRWDEDPPPKPPPPRSVGKLAIGAQLLGGTVRLANSAGESDWTSLQGVGARASYAPLKWLSVEGAIDYLKTGEAAMASASGGRAQLNALLQFGDKIVPYARVGGGVVLASVDEGDTSDFRASTLFTFGVGAVDFGLVFADARVDTTRAASGHRIPVGRRPGPVGIR